MLDILIESRRRGRRDVRGAVLGLFASGTFQAAVALWAVYATTGSPQAGRLVPPDAFRVMLPPDHARVEHPQDVQPVIPSLGPLPLEITTPDLPGAIPEGIAPIDFGASFDPRNDSGVGAGGGIFNGEPGTPRRAHGEVLYGSHFVDEIPERISCPVPEYPPRLQEAGIEGQVLLQFVVDTDGHVLERNIEALSSSHRALEGPARGMLSRCRFRPGRVRGTAVRVMVRMPVVFSITGGR